MKLCGFKESCFINGEKVWGHYGGVMCLYLSEREAKPKNISVCEITNEDVDVYTTYTVSTHAPAASATTAESSHRQD